MSSGKVVLQFALLCSLLRPFPVGAQVPAQPKVIIEAVDIHGAPHLPYAEREQLVSFLKQQEFDGASGEWVGKLETMVLGELPPRWNQDYQVREVFANWRLMNRDSSGDLHVSVTVALTESPPHRLMSIRFENAPDATAPTLFPVTKLRNLIPLRDGEIFSDEQMREGINAVAKLYKANSYPRPTVSPTFQIDDGHRTISVVVKITATNTPQ